MGEAVAGYLQAVGHPDEDPHHGARRLHLGAGRAKKLKGVCVCTVGVYGNAASRMSEFVPSNGAYAYGGWPDVDALYKQQARETDRKKREAMLHQIQQTLCTSACASGRSTTTSGRAASAPRVAEPALMLIDPYPWSAPLEELRLKK